MAATLGGRKWEYNNDASGPLTNAQVVAAAAARNAYVTHIFFNSAPGGTLKILDASGGNVKFGTVTIGANGTVVLDRSANPIAIGQGKGVFVTTTGAGVACVNLAGYVI